MGIKFNKTIAYFYFFFLLALTANLPSMTLIYEIPKLDFMRFKFRNNDTFPKKCMQCICGIENDRGIWCARLKKIPASKEVKRCRQFCPKEILNEV